MNQLQNRGFSLASRSPLCKEAKEAMEHLLIHCPKIWCMRTTLFNLTGGGWVCPFLVNDLILGWPSLPWGEEGDQAVEGGASLSDVGNLEGEE